MTRKSRAHAGGLALSLALLGGLLACGGSGGGDAPAAEPEATTEWDVLSWDDGEWS